MSEQELHQHLVSMFEQAGFAERTCHTLADAAIRAATIEKNRETQRQDSIRDIAIKLATRGIEMAPRLRAKAIGALDRPEVDIVESVLEEADSIPSPTTGETFGDLRKG